ncbi:MAG: DUF2071 domain-containing protein [Acidobacteriota bacterium]
MTRPFLTARWEDLILLNWACPQKLLEPLVPAGTELDPWQGENFVSLVGFRFLDTRVKGFAIPFHRHFDEVNLRFYVRRQAEDGELRRAVVFVRELVPRRAIAAIARWLYNEPYSAVPMSSRGEVDPESGGELRYLWKTDGTYFGLSARAEGPARQLEAGSAAEFITEHYWGYTRQRDGGTAEYQVEHPPWRVWEAAEASFEGDGATLYGNAFGELLAQPPTSAFVAIGSEVAVYPGRRLPT